MSGKSGNNDIVTVASLDSLKRTIAHLTEDGELFETDISGLGLFTRTQPTQPYPVVYVPSICMVLQGEKCITLGEDSYTYNELNYLITSVDLPTSVQILRASEENPYLGLRLILDHNEITKMIMDSDLSTVSLSKSERAMSTGKVTPELVESFNRLVNLLYTPSDIPVLAPLIKKEILYRLLMGEQGFRLHQIAASGSQSRQIARIIEFIKNNFKRSISMDSLAEQACMSLSTFHHHFRSMTAMSPLQYIKTLKLHEARRLMLSEGLDAASAAFGVGYESPSQFNREYKRQFGDSPQRDIKKLSGELLGAK